MKKIYYFFTLFITVSNLSILKSMLPSQAAEYDSSSPWFKENIAEKITIAKQRQLAQFLIKFKIHDREDLKKFRLELEKDKELKNILENFDKYFYQDSESRIFNYYSKIYINIQDMQGDLKELLSLEEFKRLRN